MAIRHSTPADNSFTPLGKIAWDAGHDGDSSDIAFVPSGTGAQSTTVQSKNRENLSTFDFYSDAKKSAIRAGTQTDVTTEFALAVAEACSSHRALKINEGPQVLSAGVSFTSAVDLFGEGYYSQLLVDSAVGASTDILKIVPGVSTGIRLFSWRNFRLSAVSGTPGRHAIYIDLSASGAYVANARFEKLWMDTLGGRAFVLSNTIPNTDGFFTTELIGNYFANGIQLLNAGDSILILGNTITGSNVGIEADLVSGGSNLQIISNNITSIGGAIWIKKCYHPSIIGNNIESSVAISGGSGNSAQVDLDGNSGAPMISPIVRDNSIRALSLCSADQVRCNYTDTARIEDNDLTTITGKVGLRVAANAVGTRKGRNYVTGTGSNSSNAGDTTFSFEPDLYENAPASGQAGHLSVAGTLRSGAGTAGVPGFAIQNDPDTGMYSSGTNTIDFSAGGAHGLQVVTTTTGGEIDFVKITPSNVGFVNIAAIGDGTNVNLSLDGKGTGAVRLASHYTDFVSVTGATGSVKVAAVGGSTDIDFQIAAKGAGVLDARYAVVALGAGAAPTVGTIGGSGPAAAAQNSWGKIKFNGTAYYFPLWI